VRYDSGSYQGWEVPIYYDPLLAKLCVWAETRDLAINRLSRVLNEYTVEGIQTTIPFFRALVNNEAFRRGEFDTGFIDRVWKNGEPASKEDDYNTEIADIAVIASILHTKTSRERQDPSSQSQSESRWKLAGRVARRK
jgi:acetyl-CoA carboxylase biotin carboxylase subunit